MAEILKLSVVMATYNRAETIRETLAHLAAQTLAPSDYEVIIVDDGSPDDTRAVAEAWIARAPGRARYLSHANRGPGYTQNRGLEVAQAPIVLLMADDIFMAPGTLAAHLAAHVARPEPEVAALGRVEQPEWPDASVFLQRWDPFRFSAFAGQQELPYYRFWACNISVKRDFVLRYGPFREHRGRGGAAAHEDPELGFQLSRAGLRIVYAIEALGYHHHVMTLEQACRRRYMQGLNFGEFNQWVPMPEIAVAYHVLGWRTLADHLRAWFGPRRRYLQGVDRNPAGLLLWHAARACVFNALTVRLIWEPATRLAETSPAVARLVNATVYRGMLFHHFLRGCRDGARRFDRPSNRPNIRARRASGSLTT